MALGLTPPLVCVLFNNHPIIIFIVIFIFTNNHLRCVSCSTITPSLSLSTQCFHNAPNYIDLDLLDYQLINLQKYTTPPPHPLKPQHSQKQLPICQEDQSLQVLISVHPRLPPKICIAASQFLSRSCARL